MDKFKIIATIEDGSLHIHFPELDDAPVIKGDNLGVLYFPLLELSKNLGPTTAIHFEAHVVDGAIIFDKSGVNP